MLARFSPLKVSFGLIVIAGLLWIAVSMSNGSCLVHYQISEVNGASLSGFIEHGDKVRIAFGYYNCTEVSRGDVVAYRDVGSAHPLLKVVRAIAGDSFGLALAEGGAKILVNGEILKNANNEPYRIRPEGYRLLSLYEKDYGGTLPQGAVLLLGNLTAGSRDSTQFGFASVGQLVGKVVEIVPAR